MANAKAWFPKHPVQFIGQDKSQKIFASTSNVVSAGACDCPVGCREPCKLTSYNTCWRAHCKFLDPGAESENDTNEFSESDTYYTDDVNERSESQPSQPRSFLAPKVAFTDENIEYTN